MSEPPFLSERLAIRTTKNMVAEAEGQVFLVAGMGRPRRYFLWETFTIESVRKSPEGMFIARGPGWQLAPPAELTGAAFEQFQSDCANFISFRDINKHPYTRTLRRLADARRPPGKPGPILKFLDDIDQHFSHGSDDRVAIRKAMSHYRPTLALSVRQPYAEAILRGVKKIEYRNGPTHVRGRVLIYASLKREHPDVEDEMMKENRIRDAACDDLPRGLIVGSVELHHNPGITDVGLKELAQLKRLTWVDLHETKVTTTGASRLSQSLPKTRVVGGK